MRETTAMLLEHPFPTRERYGDAAAASGPSSALASTSDCPLARAGELVLTAGQEIALLRMRRSDWAAAVVEHLISLGRADCAIEDYRALAAAGLAVNKGSFHVLTSRGRWRADQVAIELARAEGMHVITYDFGRTGRAAKAASACCTCGWQTFKSRAIPSYLIQTVRAGRRHLEHVGSFLATAEATS